MKKIVCWLMIVCFALSLCACVSPIPPAAEPANRMGVTLTMEEVTPVNGLLICVQEGGELRGELQTGEDYILEKWEGGSWVAVPTVLEEYGWNSIAWLIQPGRNEFPISWEWLYGSLPKGQYRIGKSFMDFVEAGDWEEIMVYAQFEIE